MGGVVGETIGSGAEIVVGGGVDVVGEGVGDSVGESDAVGG